MRLRSRRRSPAEAHVDGGAERPSAGPAAETIFRPLAFRNLTIPNRLLASSIGNRVDFYDGTGSEIRMRWDVKWAKTGVGAMISTHAPVDRRGNLSPHFAHI